MLFAVKDGVLKKGSESEFSSQSSETKNLKRFLMRMLVAIAGSRIAYF